MRVLLLLALTIIGLSSTAYAEPTLIMNCAYPNDDYRLLQALKEVTNAHSQQTGVPEGDLQSAITDAQRAMAQGSMAPFRKSQFVTITNTKIIHVEGLDEDASVAQVCLVLEGDLVPKTVTGELK